MGIIKSTFVGLAVSILAGITGAASLPIAKAVASTPKITNNCSLYASTTGSDTNNGSLLTPFATPQKLFDSLTPGQTGCLFNGSYSFYELRMDHTGTASAPITLTSYPGQRATLVTNTDFYIVAGNSHIILSHLNLTNNAQSSTIQAVMLQDLGSYDSWLSDNIYANSLAHCMSIGSEAAGYVAQNTGSIVKDDMFHDCGNPADGNQEHAIYVADSVSANISENLFWNTAAYAIQLYPAAENSIIQHNVFDTSGYGAVIFASDQTASGNVSNNNTVAYNIVTNGAHYGLDYYWGPAGQGVGNTAHDNCSYNNAWGDVDGSMPGILLSHNVHANPMYTNAATHDYTLKKGSPCLSVVQYDTAAAVKAAQ